MVATEIQPLHYPIFVVALLLVPDKGPGLPNYVLAQTGGTESNTLTSNNIPHTHAITGTAGIFVSGEDGRQVLPLNNFPAVNGDYIYSTFPTARWLQP